ncbi:MAG: UDP-N-acetylmuramoyl-L-alanine--D-glutamate ligase [Anaerolineales bacterium]
MNSVVILGLARQGKALARFFAGRGARVVVSDRREAAALEPMLEELAGLDVEYAFGGHPLSLLDGADLLCISGGVPADLPLVQEARRRGIPVTNDAQEFLRRCPAPVIGITGSAGKTTTTSLVGQMVREAGFTTWVGGNIGNPLLNDLGAMSPEDRVVMELSSFQLEIMDVSPQVAGVLNITPNHLDRHGTMEVYRAAKANVVTHQGRGDVAILGYDEPDARALASLTDARVRYFSGAVEVEEGAFLREGVLLLRRKGAEQEVCRREDLRLRGFHNVLNTLAAIALADAGGAPVAAMQRAIAAFAGVEHRLEEVGRHRGVLWVNDSIATTPERVLAALDAFEEPLVLLVGGRDKDLPWEAFARRVVERVRLLILFGEAQALIAEQVTGVSAELRDAGALEAVVGAGTLEQAVAEAARRARPGEVVLLSPGGTSFDAFRDFAARGERFRQLVGELA